MNEPSKNNADTLETFHRPIHLIDPQVDHALCLAWRQIEKSDPSLAALQKILARELDDKVFDDLIHQEHLIILDGKFSFSEKAQSLARDLIRRRRLAERLLKDVIDVSGETADSQACELEHFINKSVEESICILLGHPKECPHGLAIPPGQCCKEDKDTLESIISPLTSFNSGEKGRVCYILTRNHPQMHKLMALGIVPGKMVHIHQTFPSHIIKVDETQLALEKDVAENIYLHRL